MDWERAEKIGSRDLRLKGESLTLWWPGSRKLKWNAKPSFLFVAVQEPHKDRSSWRLVSFIHFLFSCSPQPSLCRKAGDKLSHNVFNLITLLFLTISYSSQNVQTQIINLCELIMWKFPLQLKYHATALFHSKKKSQMWYWRHINATICYVGDLFFGSLKAKWKFKHT